MSEFKKMLIRFAKNYEACVAVPIVVKADELEQDKTFVCLLEKWDEYRSWIDSDRKHVLDLVANDYEWAYESNEKMAIESYEDDRLVGSMEGCEDAIMAILAQVYGN